MKLSATKVAFGAAIARRGLQPHRLRRRPLLQDANRAGST